MSADGAIADGSTGLSAPTGVGAIATSISTPMGLASTVTHYVDWTGAEAGAAPVDHYRIYSNGGFLGTSTVTNYTDATPSVARPVPKYTVSAVDADGHEGPRSGAMTYYIYHHGLGVAQSTGIHINALIAADLSAGVSLSDDATNAQPGRDYCLKITNSGYGLWQPASTFFDGVDYGAGPYGFDLTPFVAWTTALKPNDGSDPFAMHIEYNGPYDGANDLQSPIDIPDIHDTPGLPVLISGAWNTGLQIPLPFLGWFRHHSYYKFFFDEHVASTTWYMDDVGFVTGYSESIYTGGAPTSFNAGSPGSWNDDPSLLLNGWEDDSSGNVNYSYSAGSLTQLTGGVGNAGGGSANGLKQPGLDPTWTDVIEVSTSANDGYWEIKNGTGRSLASYSFVTLALLPTKTTRSWTLQFLDASGNPIGAAVNPMTFSTQDWGPGGAGASTYWTVSSIPLGAFGSIGSTAYGLRLTDTSGIGANTFYVSAPGFFGPG